MSAGVERHEDGRLDDILSEAAAMPRVLYLTATVTLPAGVTVVTLGSEVERYYLEVRRGDT